MITSLIPTKDLNITPLNPSNELEVESFDSDYDLEIETLDSENELEVEELESHLPAQVKISRIGRPRDFVAVEVASNNPEEPKRYLGSDGRYHKETPKAARAFTDYLNLGPNRSFQKLADKYVDEGDPEWSSNVLTVRRVIAGYSTKLDWQNRLRLHLAKESASAVFAARKSATRPKFERIRRAGKLMEIGEAILDRASLINPGDLTPEQARQLVKPAITMMQVGLAADKAEIGESLERIQPPKPIEAMTDDELDAYIEVLRTEL